MSGGHWNYIQHRFDEVIEDLTTAIERNGQKKEFDEMSAYERGMIDSYPEYGYYERHSEAVLAKFKEARLAIAIAQEHIQRMDWYISGDDSEESYLRLVDENINEIKEKYKL